MAKTGPKLSPNPGKTARYYRGNKKARLKHRRTNTRINNTPQKRAYRRKLMRLRRKRKPGPQTDMSHKGGKIVAENRKANRRRGATQEKGKKMMRKPKRLPPRRPGTSGPRPPRRPGHGRPVRPPRPGGSRPPRPPRPPRPGGPRPPRPGFGRPTRPRPPRPPKPPRRRRPPRRPPVRPPVRRPRPPRRRRPPRRPPIRRKRRLTGRRPTTPRKHTGIR